MKVGWEAATAIYFAYIAATALVLPRLAPPRRTIAAAVAIGGLLTSVAAERITLHPVLRDWILPPSLLVVAYWSSGLLFVAPMPRAERLLIRIDNALRI